MCRCCGPPCFCTCQCFKQPILPEQSRQKPVFGVFGTYFGDLVFSGATAYCARVILLVGVHATVDGCTCRCWCGTWCGPPGRRGAAAYKPPLARHPGKPYATVSTQHASQAKAPVQSPIQHSMCLEGQNLGMFVLLGASCAVFVLLAILALGVNHESTAVVFGTWPLMPPTRCCCWPPLPSSACSASGSGLRWPGLLWRHRVAVHACSWVWHLYNIEIQVRHG